MLAVAASLESGGEDVGGDGSEMCLRDEISHIACSEDDSNRL